MIQTSGITYDYPETKPTTFRDNPKPMNQTTTDKATARPWAIHKQHHRMRIISRSGEPGQPGFRFEHVTADWHEQKSGAKRGTAPSYFGHYLKDEANAALIVEAVNQHDALKACAEALEQCLNALTDETGNEAMREADAATAARQALSTLNAIRNKP